MITKFLKTIRTLRKIRIFPHKSHEKSSFAYRNTPVRYREGGCAVGSGTVSSIIE